jgi:hypothetical protein
MVNERVIGEAVAAAIKMASRLLGKRVCLVMGVIAPPAITWRKQPPALALGPERGQLAGILCVLFFDLRRAAGKANDRSKLHDLQFIVVFSGSRFAACIPDRSVPLSERLRQCHDPPSRTELRAYL